MKNQDQYSGCLIGGGAGDSLGYTAEFFPASWIFAHYGRRCVKICPRYLNIPEQVAKTFEGQGWHSLRTAQTIHIT